MATNSVVVLEDAVLLSMATNPNFTSAFPFLGQAKAPGNKTCRPCAQKAANRVNAMNSIKQTIINLAPDKKVQLKKLLNAEKVKIRLSISNKVVEHTF